MEMDVHEGCGLQVRRPGARRFSQAAARRWLVATGPGLAGAHPTRCGRSAANCRAGEGHGRVTSWEKEHPGRSLEELGGEMATVVVCRTEGWTPRRARQSRGGWSTIYYRPLAPEVLGRAANERRRVFWGERVRAVEQRQRLARLGDAAVLLAHSVLIASGPAEPT